VWAIPLLMQKLQKKATRPKAWWFNWMEISAQDVAGQPWSIADFWLGGNNDDILDPMWLKC